MVVRDWRPASHPKTQITYVCVYVCVRVCVHTHTHTRTHARTHARTRARTHTHTHTYHGRYEHDNEREENRPPEVFLKEFAIYVHVDAHHEVERRHAEPCLAKIHFYKLYIKLIS